MPDPYEGWTILELFGHRRLAGWVTEAEIGGGKFIRIDVPGPTPEAPVATQFYGPAAIYCMTPTTEAMARAVAKSCQPTPVQRWEIPERPALAAPVGPHVRPGADDDLDDPDDAEP